MKHSKISISFYSISLMFSIYTECTFAKPNITRREIIVESSEVTNSTPVVLTSEEVTTLVYVKTTPTQEENDVISKEGNNISVSAKNESKKIVSGIEDDPNYVKGNFGGYYYVGDGKSKNYFFHGKYQKPTHKYYGNYNHQLEDKSTLGYYLGYSINRMDHNEYFRHHNYTGFKVHHYFFKNNTMLPEQMVSADHLVHCAQNTSVFCPENTEAICLQNTTVWCASQIYFTKLCKVGDSLLECVMTRLPCVKPDEPKCDRSVEIVNMPCISKIKVLDPYEDKNGNTLISVAGTFVLQPAIPIKKRTYCVTIVAEPTRDPTK